MRVLMIEPSGRAGLCSYTDGLCRGLIAAGADVTLLTAPPGPPEPTPYPVERRLLQEGVSAAGWSRLRWAFDRGTRTLRNSLLRVVRAYQPRPDVVHLQRGAPLFDQYLMKLVARRLPLVVTVHDVVPHSDRFASRHAFLRRFYHVPQRLIVHYEAGRREMAEVYGLPEDSIDVIPHGLLEGLPAPPRDDARRQLEIPESAEVVLFFGSIRDNKGLDVLIRSFARIREVRPNAMLAIAGHPYREVDWSAYEALIDSSGIRDCTRTAIGFVPEDLIDTWYAAADVVALPYTRFGSQSGVLLRAYAHGKPVVVTRVGAMGEQVEADGVGEVVEPEDQQGLADATVSVLADLSEYEAPYASGVAEKYSWRRIAEQTLKTYRAASRAAGSRPAIRSS